MLFDAAGRRFFLPRQTGFCLCATSDEATVSTCAASEIEGGERTDFSGCGADRGAAWFCCPEGSKEVT
jgi:hypothetical protein